MLRMRVLRLRIMSLGVVPHGILLVGVMGILLSMNLSMMSILAVGWHLRVPLVSSTSVQVIVAPPSIWHGERVGPVLEVHAVLLQKVLSDPICNCVIAIAPSIFPIIAPPFNFCKDIALVRLDSLTGGNGQSGASWCGSDVQVITSPVSIGHHEGVGLVVHFDTNGHELISDTVRGRKIVVPARLFPIQAAESHFVDAHASLQRVGALQSVPHGEEMRLVIKLHTLVRQLVPNRISPLEIGISTRVLTIHSKLQDVRKATVARRSWRPR
mmetsp:Transcript_56397/g.98542  ORF Transcript_56397/g.98542 Transcript_56397/m.98542 type:complete len:269 (+) Transcript_56397:544-1350(+)